MTALVTGGSRGIGAAVCKGLAAAGHDVAFAYRSDDSAANTVVREIEACGRKALAVKAEMADEASIRGLFEEAIAQLGPIGAVVLNAGVTGPHGRLEDRTAHEMKAILDLNVLGVLIGAQEAIRRMSTDKGGKGGGIVLLSSAAAWIGSGNEFIAYAASKGAVSTMTIGLAKEVALEGIRVNAVAPGLIDTDIHASSGIPDRVDRLSGNVPMGRGGSAEEVADAILWLLSEQASYITGTVLPVSGGR